MARGGAGIREPASGNSQQRRAAQPVVFQEGKGGSQGGEKENRTMYQKRATLTETLGKAAEVGTTDHPKPVIGSSGSENDPATGQAKRRPSKKYIPVYHIELGRDRLIKVEPPHAIHNADDVVAILRDELLQADREKLICLMLNAKNVVIGMEIVSVGSLTASIAHPREIFKAAILKNAAAIILVHNHPSGDPSPSLVRLTERISRTGELLGIRLLDHAILGELDSYRPLKAPLGSSAATASTAASLAAASSRRL